MKKILYLMVASAFIGARLFAIDIKIMQLSIYRLSLFIMIFYFLIRSILIDEKVNIRIKDRQSLIIRFYFCWLIYAIYSLAWVNNIDAGIRDVFFIGSGFLCICIFSKLVKEEKDFKYIFNIMFLMIIFHNVLGWFEIQTGKYYFADLKKIDRYGQFSYNKAVRTPVTLFSNINDYATLMTFGVFISFIILLNSKRISLKILSSITIVSSATLILRTGSRGNIVGLVLGISAVFIVVFLRKFGRSVFIGSLAIALILIIVYPPLNMGLTSLLKNKVFSRFGTKSLSIRSDITRLNLIKNGLVFLLNTAGFGTGAGNIEYWMETRQVFYVDKVFNIHNWWAEILVAYGVIVFSGYVFVYLIKVKSLFNAYLKSKNQFIRNTSLGLLGFIVAFIVSSVSSSSNIDSEWLWMFWAVLIAFIGYIVRDVKERKILTSN